MKKFLRVHWLRMIIVGLCALGWLSLQKVSSEYRGYEDGAKAGILYAVALWVLFGDAFKFPESK